VLAVRTTPDHFQEGSSSQDLSIQVDPLTANAYEFVNGDPVNLFDPTGHRIACPLGDMQGCHSGTATGAAAASQDGVSTRDVGGNHETQPHAIPRPMGHIGGGESNVGNVVLEQQQIVQSDATAVADWNAQQESAASRGLGNLGSCAGLAASWVGQNKFALITGVITVASVACVVATLGICAAVAAPVIAGEIDTRNPNPGHALIAVSVHRNGHMLHLWPGCLELCQGGWRALYSPSAIRVQ